MGVAAVAENNTEGLDGASAVAPNEKSPGPAPAPDINGCIEDFNSGDGGNCVIDALEGVVFKSGRCTCVGNIGIDGLLIFAARFSQVHILYRDKDFF